VRGNHSKAHMSNGKICHLYSQPNIRKIKTLKSRSGTSGACSTHNGDEKYVQNLG
jgi:hypothetical protein